jgi:hypothetical protein
MIWSILSQDVVEAGARLKCHVRCDVDPDTMIAFLVFCDQLIQVTEANADHFLALAKELEMHNDVIFFIMSFIASRNNLAEMVLESLISSARMARTTEDLERVAMARFAEFASQARTIDLLIPMMYRIVRLSLDKMGCSSMCRVLVKSVQKENQSNSASLLFAFSISTLNTS